MEQREVWTVYVKWIAIFLGFICVVVSVYILNALQVIFAPFVIAVFMTFLFDPFLTFLKRHKIPRFVGVILLVLILFGVVYLLSLLMVSSINQLSANVPKYSERMIGIIQQLLAPLHLTAQEVAEKFGLKSRQLRSLEGFKGMISGEQIIDWLTFVTNIVKDFVFVIIFWIFMVAGKERFRDRFENAFSNSNSQIVSTVAHIVEQIQSYIVVKSLINVINGFASTLIFLLFGVDYAILWGFLVFLFYYIPNIGSLIAILPPILIMIMNNGFEFKSIAFIITIVGIQFTIGNILEPKFIGRQMDLSPVFILLSLVFWGWVWGVLGMFLAVPIAAMVKILCANIEPLKPLAVLMGVRGDAGE